MGASMTTAIFSGTLDSLGMISAFVQQGRTALGILDKLKATS
jgi:hypothetical protein